MIEVQPNISGSWTGSFSYPGLQLPLDFTIRFDDRDGRITGEADEVTDARCGEGACIARPVRAFIVGWRSGRSVEFEKRYDDIHLAHYHVLYRGLIGADGIEIAGRWDIPDRRTGTFLMIRGDRDAASDRVR